MKTKEGINVYNEKLVRPHGKGCGCPLTNEYSPALGCPNPTGKLNILINNKNALGGMVKPIYYMKKVRAKFQCHSVTDTDYNQVVAHLSAVYSEEGENKDFVEATPCGNLDMHIDKNAPASKFFKQGKSYYLDFIETE